MTKGRGPANNTTCASCREFPLAHSGTTGTAACAIRGTQEAWNSGACVLHTRAKDLSQRQVLVRQLTNTKTKREAKDE